VRDAFIGDLIELTEGRPDRGAVWLWKQAIAGLLRARRAAAESSSPRPATGAAMRAILQDLRFAARQLRRAPSHTVVVLVTLALGIGATTAVFSVANPILFRPLPFPDPDRLAMIWEVDADDASSNLGYATFADLARDSRHLASAAAMAYWTPVIEGTGASERLTGQSVTAEFFRTLGVAPALGRDFSADEDRPGENQVAMLSDGLWRRRFGADPGVVGRPIELSGRPYTVVGVLPAHFESVLTPGAEVWRPLGYEPSLSWACRTCRHLRVVARIRAEADAETVDTELNTLLARYASQHPTEYASTGLRAVPLAEQITARVRPALLLALGAGLAVLLIAGANVTNLLLARAVERQGEFAVRSALGAGVGKLLRQLLVESWLLALGGAAAGALVAAMQRSAWLDPRTLLGLALVAGGRAGAALTRRGARAPPHKK
jgi:putative ABC transport system permease protein